MIILTLIAKMIACSVILYGYYWLLLRNKRFHHYNRYYLLAATGASIVLPFVKIPIFFEPGSTSGQIVYKSIDIISVNRWEDDVVESTKSNSLALLFTTQTAIFILYGIGVIILLYVLGRSLNYIRALSKKYSYEYINALKLYNTTEPGTPFSFFKSIFWNARLDLNSEEGKQIFRHELFHVKQRHSADILFLEFVSILLWFNPFFHLIKKEIKAIHEFLADQHSISGNNQHDYAELLIMQSIHVKKSTISNYFFQTHIKRRIAMITQIKNKKYNYWTRIMVLPLSLLLFCAIALYAKTPDRPRLTKQVHEIAPHKLSKPLTVLIDAGHGGEDAGAKNDDGLMEKDLALAIARQINLAATAYNINVVMTRNEDKYPSLKERSAMAMAANASLIISVHVSAAPKIQTSSGLNPNPANGFQLYITGKNQNTMDESKLLGQEIIKHITGFYKVDAIKQTSKSKVWMLDAVHCPAVLIECGYITNKEDVAFISKSENQKKIANSILQGIVDYNFGNMNRALEDTIPGNKHTRDSVRLKEDLLKQEITHRKLAEARAILHEQGTLLQKQQEIEMVQRKIAENQYLELQHEQKALVQKQRELEWQQRKMAETKYLEIQHEQKALTQEQREMELAQREIERADIIQDTLPADRPDPVFTKVEIEATYPGGSPAWQKYILQNLRYPAKAVKNNISGTVTVEFIVDKKGKISDINVTNGPDELRAEAARVIRQSGKWIPAQQNGQIVKAYRRQSIAFQLEK
ncbi:MAG: TonB family protein [Chitinophagaceae bacterium]|nr:TonB family protein [Chitinophagaceae bacterium]